MIQSATVSYRVVHELIHYQQDSIPKKSPDLLSACINEGSADFIGKLISGGGPNKQTHSYGNANEAKLWLSSRKSWMIARIAMIGYKITEAYYEKATDKKKAISDAIRIPLFKTV